MQRWKKLLGKQPGQIGQDSTFGRLLSIAAADPAVSTIVEIGTWNGRGSTQCILSGLDVSSEKTFVSVEANRRMYELAKKNLSGSGQVDLVWGSLVDEADLDTSELTQEEETWLQQDRESIRLAPNVLETVPNRIDLLLLDGGEFSTHAEFHFLKDRVTKWLFLDDTRTRKNHKVRDWLHSPAGASFTLVFESSDRNGWGAWVVSH